MPFLEVGTVIFSLTELIDHWCSDIDTLAICYNLFKAKSFYIKMGLGFYFIFLCYFVLVSSLVINAVKLSTRWLMFIYWSVLHYWFLMFPFAVCWIRAWSISSEVTTVSRDWRYEGKKNLLVIGYGKARFCNSSQQTFNLGELLWGFSIPGNYFGPAQTQMEVIVWK